MAQPAAKTGIQYVTFRLATDDDARRDSSAEITSYELFAPDGKPIPGGVYDLRLGTTDHGYLCLTCAHGKKQCPGHRGHLALRAPVLQPIATAEARRWLRVVCLNCGTLLVDPERYRGLPPARRLAAAAAAGTEGKRCPTCRAVHPRISKDEEDHFTFLVEPAAERRPARGERRPERRGDKCWPSVMQRIFQRIPDSAVQAMGRPLTSHPRHLVRQVVEVPPSTIRPGVRSYGGVGASFHDVTTLFQHLVKRSAQLPERLPDGMTTAWPGGPVDDDLDRAIQNLQQIYYDTIMGSSSTSVTQGSTGRRGLVVGARPVHSILRNLPRKEGHIRGALLGGRVLFIARSTISGDMDYRIDEVGIPLEFARTLQVEETVQEYSRAWLTPFFLNGRRQYPGCTLLRRRATGEVHDVAGLRDARLEVGDVLLRDVVDGDLAFFNRQPTLELSSIGAHRVRVIRDPGVSTLKMNVLACENYNADFDGDQMNLTVVRGPGPRAEAEILSGVTNWFISAKTSGPVNGQVQDSTVGCYELTRSGVELDVYHAMGLFAKAGAELPRFDGYPAGARLAGRDIVTLLLAATPVNYRRVPSSYSDVYAPYVPYDPSETLTVVEQGRLLRGVLDKNSVGAKRAGGLFHLIGREYGPRRALAAIFAFQQVALKFLLYRGFTVGTADLLPSPAALGQIRGLVSAALLESRLVTGRLLRGEIIPPLGSTVHDFYERLQIEALKVSETEVLRWVLGSIRPATNGFFRMIAVGSKGSNPNLINVSGLIGQTTINDGRIGELFSFRRTSPYYPRFATDPAAYGFVVNSYVTGMTASEFIAQGMNGRFDLINKALSTSITGYFQRKGAMNNQSAIVDNHRRVTKDARVVQYLYGEDGLNPRELEKVSFPTVRLSDAGLRAAAWLDVAAAGAAGGAAELAAAQRAVDAAFGRVRADRDAFRAILARVEDTNFGQAGTAELLMPVNVRRVVEGVFIAAQAAGAAPPPLTAAGLRQRVERVEDLCGRLPYALLNEIQERRRAPVPAALAAATSLLQMLVRAELAAPVLARLSDEQLDFVVDAVRQRYSLSLVDYGSAVGVLAAQAVSEPLTQYMLDSHHRSVAGGTSKSGLVKISELFGARPVGEEAAPEMLLPLRPEALGPPAGAFAAAQEIANLAELVTLHRFVGRHATLLEPPGKLVYPPYAADAEWIAEFERSHPLVRPPGDLTNWCFRFVLDKGALVLKAVDLELVVRKIRARHPGFYVVHTAEAVPEVVVRVWLRAGLFRRADAAAAGRDEKRARELLQGALDTPIRGVQGILRPTVARLLRHRPSPGGETVSAAGTVVAAGAAGGRLSEAGELVLEERFAIASSGTNLFGALLHSAVDPRLAISNSVGDTLRLYGIEAARAKIVAETRNFMAENSPNLRHLYLYADEMFRTGAYTSIERGGLGAREHGNVFLRMSYGAPIQVVIDAALAGTKSKVYGIAAPQLLGGLPQIGSIYNTFIVDEGFVRKNMRTVGSVLDEL